MINSYNQTAARHPPQQGSSFIRMKTAMCIFTLFILAQIIGTSFFGVYFLKRLDKVEDVMSFNEDYLFLRRIQKCMKGEDVDLTLLNCKEVIDKFHSLISEVSKADISGPTHEMLREIEKSPVAVHLVGEKTTNKAVLQWMEKGYSAMRHQITYTNGKLLVESPGIYYVYSQVSFCRNSTRLSRAPFLQYIFLSRPHEADKLLLKGANTFVSPTADCALHSIQQGGVFTFRQGDKIFVNVTDLSQVNYSPGLTYFGMFKL
ncbi:CD40 ligand [Discoglossus pictus]